MAGLSSTDTDCKYAKRLPSDYITNETNVWKVVSIKLNANIEQHI